ncbi:MAG: membrane-bound lytic murein transglycosylase MltF [Bermanella sp.]|jgi:membrane-bound lytic murein transglycosylase MltF
MKINLWDLAFSDRSCILNSKLTYAILCLIIGFSNGVMSSQQTGIPLLSIESISWTEEETAYIKALNHKGKIVVATKINKSAYYPLKNSGISGFHYSALKKFSDLAQIKIDIKLVKWKEYFHKQGKDLTRVKTEIDYQYTPTLIENVDIYLDGITSTPWREKMFDIIKFVPSRQMIITRKDTLHNNLSDLNGKICAMVKHTSMEQNLLKIMHTKKINIIFMYVNNFEEMEQLVSSGKADFTIFNSDRAFSVLRTYDNLTIAWHISEIQVMGWAINKKEYVLKSILKKYLNYAQNSEILDKYWFAHYGVPFIEYLRVINIAGSPD